MELLPALDLRGGRVVRLHRGLDTSRTTYDRDPLEVLRTYSRAGVACAHVVDLDAAFGEPPQVELLEKLLASPERPRLQLGGGLRDRDRVSWALDHGFETAVITSLMVRDFELFSELARAYPRRLVAALDCQGGELRLAGWTESASQSLQEVCAALRDLPLSAILVTDIDRDGDLSGPNVELACELGRACDAPALVSGGVSSLDDLRVAATHPEVRGAVVGKALYDGAIDLSEALAVCAQASATRGTGSEGVSS